MSNERKRDKFDFYFIIIESVCVFPERSICGGVETIKIKPKKNDIFFCKDS